MGVWAIVWQLKSFYYAYGKNIMGGLFREGKTRYGETGNIAPAIMPLFFGAALLMPLTMIGWDQVLLVLEEAGKLKIQVQEISKPLK